MHIDIKKKYRTKKGDKVRIYAVEKKGSWPVHGAIFLNDEWCSLSWTKDGISGLGLDYNLADAFIKIKA